jgi:ComF family protein
MLIDSLLAWLAPHECLGCCAEGRLLCDNCRHDLVRPDKRCYKCHKPGRSQATCPVCQLDSPLASIQAATRYSGAGKELIHKLKFGRAKSAATEIADILATRLGLDRDMAAYGDIVIVHAPTATSRVRQRGYDQSRLVARALSARSGIPCYGLLARVGQHRQVGASKAERKTQMLTAYHPVAPKRIRGAHVLLVDDVCTTGSTLEAAAAVLLQAGAKRVDGIVFAKA